jgi:hypothetical protein
MLRSIRAVALAAAAFALAAFLWDDPIGAFQGEQAPVAGTSFIAHASAVVDMTDLGLNTPETTEPAPDGPPGDPGAAIHLGQVPDDPPAPPLIELVADNEGAETANAEQDCLASAVYFEAQGEPLEGQLAVAEVVLNRTRSGLYPATICGVVTQPAQFSFVRRGTIPRADRRTEAWRRAVAVARIAQAGELRLLPRDVLWYHADYVAPGWGRRLARNTKIGLHIFYS